MAQEDSYRLDSSFNAESDGGEKRKFRFSTAMIQHEKGYYRNLFAQHKYATITYCLVFWSFGMCVGILGPTLWDLGCLTGTVLSTVKWVIFAQSISTMIGSMLGGFFINQFTPNPVLFVGITVITLTLAMIPFCHAMPALAIVLAIMGFNMGLLDTTANVCMIRLYGSDVSPFLQAMHFFYGFGAFLTPIIVEPFLENNDCSHLIDNSTLQDNWFEQNVIGNEEPPSLSLEENMPSSLEEARSKMRVHYAFWIMAVLQIPIAILVFSLITTKWCSRLKQNDISATNEPGQYNNLGETTTIERQESWRGCCTKKSTSFIVIILFTGLLLFFADGLQASFGDFIFTYARLSVNGFKRKPQLAAVLVSCFWGMFALGRLLATFAAVHFTPFSMLTTDLIGSMFAMLLMVTFRHSQGVIYFGTLLFGLFLASIYPSGISFTEQFVDITPSATSCIVVAAAAGEVICPVIVGNLFDGVGPTGFLVSGTIGIVLMMVVLFALWLTGMHTVNHQGALKILSKILPWCFDKPDERSHLIENDFLAYQQEPTDGESERHHVYSAKFPSSDDNIMSGGYQ